MFLTLKITVFCNLVLFNHASTLLSWLFYSLPVSAVLDHFGYPAPHLDQWQQRVWYDLGAIQEVLHQMRIRLSRAFPQSPVPQGPSHLLPPTGQLQCRSILLVRRNSLRPRKVGASAPSTVSTGHPCL